MNKTAYMNALRAALEGLPAAAIEETMWAYEAKFTDAAASGKSEEEITATLPKPELVAAQKKTSMRYDALKKNFTLGNIASLLIALIGLMVFNLFMLIPAITYFSLLCSGYVIAMVLYIAGIGMTAASLSGVDEFSFDMPAGHHHRVHNEHRVAMHQGSHGNVRVDITDTGVLVDGAKLDEASPAPTSTPVATTAAASTATSPAPNTAAGTAASTENKPAIQVESDDTETLHIEVGNHFSTTSLLSGVGMLLAGILLFMFSMFMTKYTFIGVKYYLRWNLSQLQLVRPA